MFGTLLFKIPIIDVVFPGLRIRTLIIEIKFVKSDELGNMLGFWFSIEQNVIIACGSTRNDQGFDGFSSFLFGRIFINLVGW